MRALVLSGGGSKGPYHVGALRYLLKERGKQFDILCGVSVGALVATTLAQFPLGKEPSAVDALEDIFLHVETKDIWKHWPLFRRAAGLWKPSFMNSAPLAKLVHTRLDMDKIRAANRQLRVGAVSLTTGRYTVFDQTHPELASAVIASAAFPAFLTPVKMEGQVWTDGGVRTVTPIQAAIDAGATDITVIMLSPPNSSQGFDSTPSAVKVAERSIDLMSDEVIAKDVKVAQLYTKLAEAGLETSKRPIAMTILRPSSTLLAHSLEFKPVEAVALHKRGYEDAKALFGR